MDQTNLMNVTFILLMFQYDLHNSRSFNQIYNKNAMIIFD